MDNARPDWVTPSLDRLGPTVAQARNGGSVNMGDGGMTMKT